MRYYVYIILIAAIFLMSSCSVVPEPVNPNATFEARELLSRLYEIQGEMIFSGQHNYPHQLTRSSDTVYSYTGKYPVVWGCDLRDAQDFINDGIEEAIRQHDKGAIVTAMSHMDRPFDTIGTRRSSWREMSDEQWADLITPGTELHYMLIDRIDNIAGMLKKLDDANVPVLWRPFHEMNGIWFWWGNRPGQGGFEELWKIMYYRYTDHHGLNNLIWVWNPNAPRDLEGDEAYAYELFYPGHRYVDVLAADVYHNDYRQSHHDDLLELADGKPIGLGEVGVLPTPEILEQQPMWTWFMCWANWIWTHNTPEQVRELYESPRVVTLGDLKD